MKVNLANFDILLSVLKAHEDNGVRFKLDTWHNISYEDGDWCGTAACACGLLALSDEGKEAGFRIERNGRMSFLSYKGDYDWDAVEQFFGISYDDAHFLFLDESYDDYDETKLNDVISRIERFIAEKLGVAR
jgi:hypothetical protein